MNKKINFQSNSGRQNYNVKFKIIFSIGIILFLSGCAGNGEKKINLKSENPPASPQAAVAPASHEPVRILFVGDMMFDRYIRVAAEKHGGDYGYPLLPLKNFLSGFDLVVGNLEGPITGKSSTSVGTEIGTKKNLVFTFDPKVAKALAENNIKLVNLGNNHILNQGEEGFLETKKYLDEAEIAYFGYPMEAKLPFGSLASKTIGGMKISFIGYNYSEADAEQKTLENIKKTKDQGDIVIVYPHWGTEFKTGDPGEKVRALAHQFVDAGPPRVDEQSPRVEAGADLIIGTHPHVVESSEIYKGKKIYYSLGNFVFDQYFQKETMGGLGVGVEINPETKEMKFEEVKFEMMKNGQTKLVQN